MKKILLLLASTPLLFNSCLKNNDIPDPDPMQPAIIIYEISNSQNALALDPWNIAVRLNSLLIEARDQAGDVEDLTGYIVAESKKNLLGSTTDISYNQADGIYTLAFYGSTPVYNDLARNGTLFIRTNGYATLEEDATWEIYTATNDIYSCLDAELSYRINLDALDNNQIVYTVRAVSESHFEVNMQHFNVWITKEYGSNWTAFYEIYFNGSFPTPAEFKDAKYSVSIDSDYSTTAGLRASDGVLYSLHIAQRSDYLPMKYDVGCGKAPIDGELTVSVYVGQYDYKECQIGWTPTSTKCKSNITLRYDGNEKTY